MIKIKNYISQRRQIVKVYLSGIGKTKVIYPCAFLVSASIGIMTLGMIFYLRNTFHATKTQIGAFTATWFLLYILGCLFVRPFFSKLKPRFSILIATSAMFLCSLSFAFIEKIFFMYIIQALLGLSASFFWPSMMGWLSAGAEGKELNKLMSKFNLSWSSATIISPWFSGWLVAKNPLFPIYASAICSSAAALLIIGAILSLSNLSSDDIHEVAHTNKETKKDKSTKLRFPAWIGVFFAYSAAGILVTVFPLFCLEKLQLTTTLIGFLVLIRSLFLTAFFLIMGSTTFWHFRPAQMLISQGIFALLIFFLGNAENIIYIAIISALMGACMSISYFNSMFHGITGSLNRAGRSAIHESLLASGIFTGSILGGFLYDLYSVEFVYKATGAILLLGLVIQVVLVKKIQHYKKTIIINK